MFKLFSSNHAASIPIDCSTNDSLNETLPGGPSPDTAVPLQDEAIDSLRPYRASAESAGAESRPPPQRPSRNLTIADTRARYPRGLLSSEARGEKNPAAVVGTDGGTGEGSLGGSEEARRSTSVESRHPNRSVATNAVIGDGAFANSVATSTVANEAPDVDPSLQSRAASADEELEQRDKAATSKEERAFRLPIQNRPSAGTQQ
jgi:hypothetical protein